MKRIDQLMSAARDAGAHAPVAAPSDDISPGCPLCGGAGFVRRRRPVEHPLFGRAEPCDCVMAEAAETRTSRLQRISNLGTLARFTFETLSPNGRGGGSETFGAVMGLCAAFAEKPEGWLVLTGPSGTGKTHLAAAIANASISAGLPVLFVVVPDLLDHLRASYDATDAELGYEQLFEQVRSAQLLVLDDIDAAAQTPWAKEKLFQIVNHRWNAQLPTVFTSSTPPGQLDDRLATRLADERIAQVLQLVGPPGARYHEVGGMKREKLDSMQFRDFDLKGPALLASERDSLEAALNAAKVFAEHPRGWFVLTGDNGCGKTHLAAAIANRALHRGSSVFFAVVPDLMDHLRSSFAPGRDAGYDEVFEDVRTSELLILDDLGAHNSSLWAQEKLYQIVNYRTLASLPTVVTTNLMGEEFRKAQPRIQARIADPKAGVTIRISAPHYWLQPGPTKRSGGPPSPHPKWTR